jgi:hypothetical protein
MATLDEMIAVMQAAADGKVIEASRKAAGNWIQVNNLLWNWTDFDYRVKRVARVFYIVFNHSGDPVGPYCNESHAKAYATNIDSTYAKFVEEL